MDLDKLIKLAELYSEAAKSRNDYMREYMRNRYHSKRNSLIQELGGKCKKCGTTEGPLHIDHIDASKKTFRAADVHSVSDKKLKEEKKNFQLLCNDCHKAKTHEAWDYSTPKPRHGTYWMFKKHKCRCDKCTTAYKEKIKEWNNKD